MKTSNILIAIENLAGGGAERVALDLVRHWPENSGHPILLVASQRGEYSGTAAKGIDILEVGVSSSPRNTVPFLRSLRKRFNGLKVDGVVSHMTAMNRMMLRAKVFGALNAPVVAVEHNNFLRNLDNGGSGGIRRRLLEIEIGSLYKRAHKVVGCSEGVAEQFKDLFALPPNKVCAIENPIDSRFLQRAPMTHEIGSWFRGLAKPVCVTIGRMVPQKGFEDLLRAFSIADTGGSLIILGEGPLRAKLEQLADALDISERVRMPGFVDMPEVVLQAADLFVSASHWEGYPLSFLEAYASGLPIVARNCDFGPEEIVLGSRPGKLVSSNSIEALSQAISESIRTETRFEPGEVVDLSKNKPGYVASRYAGLFKTIR